MLSKDKKCLSTQLTLGCMRARYTDYARKREEKRSFFLEVIDTKLKAGGVRPGNRGDNSGLDCPKPAP